MARPKNHLFTYQEKTLEAKLINIVKEARKTSGSSANKIVDEALEELTNLYDFIHQRTGN